MGSSRQSDHWYYSPSGQTRIGPVTEAEIRNLIAKGDITAETAIRRPYEAQWVMAADIPGLIPEPVIEKPARTAPTPAPEPEPAEQGGYAGYIIAAILAVGLLGGAIVSTQQHADEPEAPKPARIKSVDPSWRKYTDETGRLTFKHPRSMDVFATESPIGDCYRAQDQERNIIDIKYFTGNAASDYAKWAEAAMTNAIAVLEERGHTVRQKSYPPFVKTNADYEVGMKVEAEVKKKFLPFIGYSFAFWQHGDQVVVVMVSTFIPEEEDAVTTFESIAASITLE